MDLIHTAKAEGRPELIIDFDPRGDLHYASQLPSAYDPEIDAFVENFRQRWLASLAEIAEERDVTVYVSYGHDQRSAGYDDDTTELVREIWQAAHDRTPAKV